MTSQHNDHDPIARRLIADAEDLSPSFSERLHQRSMRAVRAQQTRMALQSRPNWGSAIAAAAAMLLMGLSVWHYTGGELPTTAQLAMRGPVVGVDVGIADAGDLLRHGSEPITNAISGIESKGIAQLEQNARSLARFIANQLPQSDPRAAARPDQPM